MSDAVGTAVDERLARWAADDVVSRLWARDGSLWSASGKLPDDVAAWLGWLELADRMRPRVGELAHFARDVAADGYRRAAILGMGGSSLAPEMFARTFGGAHGRTSAEGVELRVLDSTHPDAVRGFREWAAAERTLFIVSSKSGTTTEPNVFHASMAAQAPALDFVAITDPDTPLAELARAQEFRAIIESPADVGGRYSALTVFGLLPAALAGVDVGGLLEAARSMTEACRRPAADNPGLRLGAFMGEAALAGRDKLTLLAAPALASFGDWAEQLIAESTGKQGTGVVPIVGEPAAGADAYADDRAFVIMRLAESGDDGLTALASRLRQAGHPVIELDLARRIDIGAEIVRWEIATAAAGIVLGIDPFDQPNVQESKDATRALLDACHDAGVLPAPMPLVGEAGASVVADPAALGDTPVTVAGAVDQLFSLVEPGRDYVGLLAYLPPDPDVVERLNAVRVAVRDRLGPATTLGLGPRFLHSTGQLHKGGPHTGAFLQVTADPRRDLPIPGWEATFGTLVAAQALGDLQSLQRRGRRVVRLHFDSTDTAVDRLEEMVGGALGVSLGRSTASA